MKVGDLVKLSGNSNLTPVRVGLVVELVEKKCWRTDVRGRKVDWSKIEPEAHAVVVIKGNQRTIPVTDLELWDEGR